MIKIAHIIPSLDRGGAERQLLNLVTTQHLVEHTICVFFGANNSFQSSYDLSNVKVIDLSRLSLMGQITFLIKFFRDRSYGVVQCWMYHACILSVLFGSKKTSIVWNIRRAGISRKSLKLKTYLIVRLLSFFSSTIPSGIVYCAKSALESHVSAGFLNSHQKIIYNGFDFNFKNSVFDSDLLRLGFVGRDVPEKNFIAFFRFLEFLEQKEEKVLVNIVGRGYESFKSDISKFNHVKISFKGEVSDMTVQYIDMDMIVSTSLTEGFPNVIAEAMGHGVLPLCTNVGDSLSVINGLGVELRSLTPSIMYEDFLSAKSRLNKDMRKRLRSSVKNRFGQDRTNNMYLHLWKTISR